MAEGTCTIGRIGLSTSAGGDGYSIYEPDSITQSGTSIRLSGLQDVSTVTLMQWLRDGFLGLADPASDPIIPCTFSAYPQLDGFYRVNSVNADRTAGALAWGADLTRISDWGHPRIEQMFTYALTANVHSITSGSYVVGAPGNADAYLGVGTASTRSNGDSFTQAVASNSGVSGGSTTGYGQVQPANWYKGGCRAELNVSSGGTYYTITGRRSFSNILDLARLRLSNGLVRVTVSGGRIQAQWWDGSQWDSASTCDLSDVTYGSVTSVGYSVIRNAPEEVAIRTVGYITISGNAYPVFLDVSIRRGSRMVIGYAHGYGGTQWRATLTFAGACTTVSGGIRESSNNASGNRDILVSNNAATIDTANKRVSQTSTSIGNFLYGFTTELGGSGASGIDAATFAANELFISSAEIPMVVAL